MKTENKVLCKECGGRCCKSSSCIYGPEDFEDIGVSNFLDLYYKGKIMFSYVSDGEICGCVIKPAQISTPQIQENIFIGNSQCIYLKEDGCEIKDYYHRPRGGKLLIPRKCPEGDYGEDCKTGYDYFQAVIAWDPFQHIVEATIAHIHAKERIKSGSEFTYDSKLCKMCQGRCCKQSGCFFSPKDFKQPCSFEYLKKVIDKGFISIVPLSEEQTGLDDGILVLKVRNVDADICDLHGNIASPCILLEPSGCFFDKEDRPYGGKALQPTPSQGCGIGYSFRQCANDWKPYQDILKQLYNFYYDKDIVFKGVI